MDSLWWPGMLEAGTSSKACNGCFIVGALEMTKDHGAWTVMMLVSMGICSKFAFRSNHLVPKNFKLST
ncbi:hypothetical protein AgCh_001321 [Apium graveolens]